MNQIIKNRKKSKIYHLSLVGIVMFAVTLVVGISPASVRAEDATQINDPQSFCKDNLKGIWNGPDRAGNFHVRGECSSGKNCKVQIQGGIPHRTGCDVMTYDKLWHQNPADIISLLKAGPNGLPDGVTIPTDTGQEEESGTGENTNVPNSGSSTTGSDKLDDWLQNVINLLSVMVGLVIVVSIIIAGVQYMSAGGNSSQVAAAKNRISMAVLAFILFSFTYAIFQWLVPGGIFN